MPALWLMVMPSSRVRSVSVATVAVGCVAGGSLVVPSHCREPSTRIVFSVNWYTEN